jgi:hypothetical protein
MKYFLTILLFFLSSCAGYNFHYQENPFASHGIKTVAVPAFLNKSLIPNVSALMTERIASVLSQNTTLKVTSGNSKRTDATLVGIISSNTRRNEFYKTQTTTLVNQSFSPELATRREFYAPSVTNYKLNLHLVLIKQPTAQDMELLNSDLKKFMKNHPRVVFTKNIELLGSYTRVIAPSDSPDSGGAVNSTKNREVLNKSVESLATSAASSFKETVVNAF